MLLRDAHDRRYRLEFRYGLLSPADPRRTVTAWLYPLATNTDRPPRDARSGAPLQGALVGIAICSERDQFIKAQGRLLALERALDGLRTLTSVADVNVLMDQYLMQVPRSPRSSTLGRVSERLERVHASIRWHDQFMQPAPPGISAAWELS